MQANLVSHDKLQFLNKEAWHQHFTAFKTGKCSKAEYCNHHKLTYHQFIYWCRKFEEENFSAHNDYSQFVPIKIKSNPSPSNVLCTLEFNDGKRLLIHEISVVEALMGRS